MFRSALVAFVAAAMLAAVASAETPALNAVFAQLQQSVKSASALLSKAVVARRESAATQPAAARARELNVEYQDHRWQLRPNPNPPGSDFLIDLRVGDHVKLSFFNWYNPQGGDESAQFDVDGIDAVVNGKPSKGIHIWLSSGGDSATAEFDAVKAGIYLIRGSSGYILIRAAR